MTAKTKILLVMPLSTIDWGSKNSGGVDSVCQMIVEELIKNKSKEFQYRVVAVDTLGQPKFTGEVIQLSENVELVWLPSSVKLWGRIRVPSICYLPYKVRQQVGDFEPHMVNTHIWSWIMGFSRNIPSIVSVHSYKNIARSNVSPLNDWFYVEVLPSLSKLFGHKIICVGEQLKVAVENNVKQEVRIIHNPIDATYFTDKKRGSPHKPLRLVTCALLTPRKQIEKIILLTQMLNQAGVDTELAIIGPVSDKNYVQSLELQVIRENLTSKVTFCGRMNKAEIITQYNNSDIGVFFSAEETFGLVPLEMMATGLPLLATEVGILAEKKLFFEDLGVAFVNVDKPEEVLTVAQTVINKLLIPEVSQLQEVFSVSSVVKDYESLYTELSRTC